MAQQTLFDPDREPLVPQARACNQPTLFTEARARHSDPETSHLAAATVDVSRSQRLVLEILRERPDTAMTAEEIAERLKEDRTYVPPSRARGALRELQDRDPPLVVVAGRRENENGHMAQMYRAVE